MLVPLREGGGDWWLMMVVRRSVLAVLVVVFVAVLVGCPTTSVPDGSDAVVSVVIDQGDVTLVVGDAVALSATVEVVGGASRAVVWSSDDEGVARVSGEGVVTGVAPGEAMVTAASVVDGSVSGGVVVSVVEDGVVGGGVLVVRYEGLPVDSFAVLGVASGGLGGVEVRRDLLGPGGEVRVALAPGVYRARVGEAFVAGVGAGVYASVAESSWVFEVVPGGMVEREVAFELVAEIAPNVRVLSQSAVAMVEAVEGGSLVFAGRPDELADVAVGDVLLLQFGAALDVAAFGGGGGLVTRSWDWRAWWEEGVIARGEQLVAYWDSVVAFVVDVGEEAGKWVLDFFPGNVADVVTGEVGFTYPIVEDELVLPPELVWSGVLSDFSGGLTLRDVRGEVTLRGRQVLVDALGGELTEAYQPLAMPSAACYLNPLKAKPLLGWALKEAAELLDLKCPVWFVVEALDVVLEIGEVDLDFETALPVEGLKLAFAYPIGHAKFIALIVSFDVELDASMPVVTVTARERDWEFRASYANPQDSVARGVWLEEPVGDPIDVDVSLGDEFGGVSVTLSGRTHVSFAVTDPFMILQAYVGAGPGVSVSSMSGDPTLVRGVWPFEVAAFAEAKAGVRYIWKRTPREVFPGSMSLRWPSDPWRIIGDAKFGFGAVPADVTVYVREVPDGVQRVVASPFVVVAPGRAHEVWVEPLGAAAVVPSGASCSVVSGGGDGARVEIGGLGIREVCEIDVVEVSGPASVSVEPASVTLSVNGTQSFTATVTGASDTSVTWSATCGSVPDAGNPVTYTAPGSTGECEVTATSNADSSKSATAVVTVTESGADFEPAPSYISIENVSLGAASGGTRRVGFDISWDESWRGSSRPSWVAADNWDAAWVFVKYRVSGGAWQHATLASSGHVAPSGSVVTVPSDRVGAFVYRSSSGYGTFAANGVGLQWDYVADGVAAGASVEVQPFGIEMVYVPQGSFSLGSGGSSTVEFRAGGTSNTPFVVSSQSSISLGDGSGQLMWTASTYSGSPSGSTSASFPTGYGAYYAMKYQVTQGQYVDFLNTLSQAQADARKHTGSDYRYAITGSSVGSYATSLPFVAMNYISWADGAAFADWAGLRPMTELEFEKVARGPAASVASEFAWGSTSITRPTGLANEGTITETPTPTSANAQYGNWGGSVQGPVRVGSFAAPGRSRRDAGAGYYGALELSGNLWERPVTVGNAEGRAFTGAHGDGTLDGSGNANVSSWPGSTAVGAGFRGGRWSADVINLRVSNRLDAAHTFANRFSNVGWRGARSAP